MYKTRKTYGVAELVALFVRLLAPLIGAIRDEVAVRRPKVKTVEPVVEPVQVVEEVKEEVKVAAPVRVELPVIAEPVRVALVVLPMAPVVEPVQVVEMVREVLYVKKRDRYTPAPANTTETVYRRVRVGKTHRYQRVELAAAA